MYTFKILKEVRLSNQLIVKLNSTLFASLMELKFTNDYMEFNFTNDMIILWIS